MNSEYLKFKEKLLTDYDKSCQQFFLKNGYTTEYAYSKLLDEDLQNAKYAFSSVREFDIRARWGLFLVSLIEDNVNEYPTYLSLRNFLEIDLNILLHYFKGEYVEKILRYSDFMFSINPEVYKFIGRVFYNNNYQEQAMFFLNKAKDYFYNDPELHYLLAYIYHNNNDCNKAISSCKTCLNILPEYFPAVNMLRNYHG